MFPGEPNPLSLSKILGGLSHSLNIAKRIIPIYESSKPMIKNAKNAYQKLKSFQNPKPVAKNIQKKTITKTHNRQNLPTFFR